jgi:ankyrin repeat protein
MTSAIGDARELVRPDPVGADSHVPNRFSHMSFSSSKSLLLHAIRYGPMQTVRDLLNETPKLVQVTDNRGYNTPLHYAALFGRSDMVRMLCRANAKIDAQDYSGNTPLHYSTAEMAEALLVATSSIAEYLSSLRFY